MYLSKLLTYVCFSFVIFTNSTLCLANTANESPMKEEAEESFGFFEIGASASAYTPLLNSSKNVFTELDIDVRGGYYWSDGFFISGGTDVKA